MPGLEGKNEFDVVVSGAGPAGLASAYAAAKQGKSVLVVDNREMDYVRVQRVFLDEKSRKQLLEMLGTDWNDWKKLGALSEKDMKFVLELNRSTTVAVKDIENFIKRRLDELQEKNHNIEFMAKTEINHIDMESGSLQIGLPRKKNEARDTSKDQSIKFTTLIAADGARHGTVDTYNETAKNPIKYKHVEGPKHEFHAGVYFRINSKKIINLPTEQFVETATKVDGLSYPLVCGISFDKQSYIEAKGTSIKCTFGGEVPKEVFDVLYDQPGKPPATKEQKQAAIIGHLKNVMPSYFKEHELENNDIEIEIVKGNPDLKEGKTLEHNQQKDKMRLQPFKLELVEADKAVVSEGKSTLILVGDTYRSPNYQYGHGLNHALQHAQATGKMLGNEMTQKEYHELCKSLSSEITIATKLINKLHSLGRKILIDAAHKRTEAVRQNFLGSYKIDPSFEQKLSMLQFLEKLESFQRPDKMVSEGIKLTNPTSDALADNLMKMKGKIDAEVRDQMQKLSATDDKKEEQREKVGPAAQHLKQLQKLNDLIDDTLKVLTSYKLNGEKSNPQKIKMIEALAFELNKICQSDLKNPDELSKKLITKLEEVSNDTKNSEKKHAFFNIAGNYRIKHSSFLNAINDVLKKHPEFRSKSPKAMNLPIFEEATPEQVPVQGRGGKRR